MWWMTIFNENQSFSLMLLCMCHSIEKWNWASVATLCFTKWRKKPCNKLWKTKKRIHSWWKSSWNMSFITCVECAVTHIEKWGTESRINKFKWVKGHKFPDILFSYSSHLEFKYENTHTMCVPLSDAQRQQIQKEKCDAHGYLVLKNLCVLFQHWFRCAVHRHWKNA